MSSGIVDEFIRLFLNRQVLLVVGGVYFLIRLLNSVGPISRSSIYRRLLIFIPELLSTAAIFSGAIPSFHDEHWVVKLGAGLWCGYVAQRFHKFLGQTILGDDPRIALKNTTVCAYCDSPLPSDAIRCPTCGSSTLRALSVPPPPAEEK